MAGNPARPSKTSAAVNCRWWAEDEANAGRVLVAAATRLVEELRPQHEQDRLHAILYGGVDMAGLTPATYSRRNLNTDALRRNVIASVVDTAVAKIGKNKPAPMFVTNGGDYDTRRLATQLNHFGKGFLIASGAYDLNPIVLRDAAVFGTGVVKCIVEDKRIRFDRCFPWEILVDPVEAHYGAPRQLIQRRFVDRAVLKEVFGSGDGAKARLRAIDATGAPQDSSALGRDRYGDQVEVLEGWHLRSGEGAKDGKHAIAVGGGTLLVEPWDRDRFPFAFMRWHEPVAGFFGVGVAQRQLPVQYEINYLLRRAQSVMKRLGMPFVLLPTDAGIPKSHLSNDLANILSINPGAQGPIVVQQNVVPNEVWTQIDRLVSQAYEDEGITMLSATGRKPAGLDAAVALREYNDIESERFVMQGRRWEAFHLDQVDLGIEAAKEIGNGYRVLAPTRDGAEEIKWSEVNLERDAYVLQCFPSSALPSSPAGRLQQVMEMLTSGLITPQRALEQLEIPDLEDLYNRANATSKAARKTLDGFLAGREYEPPDPDLDLNQALDIAVSTYVVALSQNAPDGRLELVRQWKDELVELIGRAKGSANGPPANAGPAVGPAPMAGPVAPPPVIAPPMVA